MIKRILKDFNIFTMKNKKRFVSLLIPYQATNIFSIKITNGFTLLFFYCYGNDERFVGTIFSLKG